MLDDIKEAAKNVGAEFVNKARLQPGQMVVVGCSTSEIAGKSIGSGGSPEIGTIVFETLYHVFAEKGIKLAAQCCEHLNRAIVVESSDAAGYEIVSVIPQPDAGGAFATAAYKRFNAPVVIEEIQADAGLDIGGTLIAMHLKRVAVPIRLEHTHIGKAVVTAAYTRPKLIGGVRAKYAE